MESSAFSRFQSSTGVLSDVDIVNYRNTSDIVIEPFNRSNLTNVAYDLTLGDDIVFVRSHKHLLSTASNNAPIGNEEKPRNFYNIVDVSDKVDIANGWEVAKIYSDQVDALKFAYENPTVSFVHIYRDKPGIRIRRNSSVLCATHEFAGTRAGTSIVAHIKGRSTLLRAGVTVCPGSGWGDVGFYGRWGILISNMTETDVFVPFKMRVAQIIFEKVSSVPSKSYKEASGTYALEESDVSEKHTTFDMYSRLKQVWTPEQILPTFGL